MEENIKKITIVTVVKNGEIFLEKTIQSVIEQDYPNIEYIIIDGGSDDGTLKVIEKYRNNISSWLTEPDKGIYDAMNKAGQLAKGEVINFLNAGDYFLNKSTVSEVMEIFNNTDTKLVYGGFRIVDRNDNIVDRQRKKIGKKELKNGVRPCHQTVFAVKSLFNEEEKFNNRHAVAADFDWVCRAFQKQPIVFLNKELIGYLSGGWSDKYTDKNLAETAEIIKKYFGVVACWLFLFKKRLWKIWRSITNF